VELSLRDEPSGHNLSEAIQEYKKLLRNHPQSFNARRAEWRIAALYFEKGWDQEAQAFRLQLQRKGLAGINVLPASSSVPRLTSLTESQQLMIQEQLADLAAEMDVLLIDTGAGISPNVTFCASSADGTMVVISPEPTSLTAAYALIKVLARQFRERRFKVLVNQAKSPREASEVFGKLDVAVDRFFHVSVELVGAIPYDDYIHMAVVQQKAVSDMFPEAPAAQAFKRLAQQVVQWPKPGLPKSSAQLVWQRSATHAGS
jgi:flagellar biosynthesis protein FlhG